MNKRIPKRSNLRGDEVLDGPVRRSILVVSEDTPAAEDDDDAEEAQRHVRAVRLELRHEGLVVVGHTLHLASFAEPEEGDEN